MRAVAPSIVVFSNPVFSLIERPNTDGEVRAMKFTPAAAGAAARVLDKGRTFFIELNAMPRAERGANAARLAPVSEDVYLEPFSAAVLFSGIFVSLSGLRDFRLLSVLRSRGF
jgi:hypothetical protein